MPPTVVCRDPRVDEREEAVAAATGHARFATHWPAPWISAREPDCDRPARTIAADPNVNGPTQLRHYTSTVSGI
jgi:hypothetical protein